MEEEIRRCMDAICAHHLAQGRQIGSLIKRRSRKGRGLQDLVVKGILVPSDLLELYSWYDGVDPGSDLNQWQSNFFLQFDFRPAKNVVDLSLLAPKLNSANPEGVIKLSGITPCFGAQLDLVAMNGPNHVCATNFPSSSKSYVAFENVLSMLQSVVLAQENDLLFYNDDGKIDYDLKVFWDLIQPLNPSANYWPKLIDQTLAWDVSGEVFPDFGNSKWG